MGEGSEMGAMGISTERFEEEWIYIAQRSVRFRQLLQLLQHLGEEC